MSREVRVFSKSASHLVTAVPVAEVSTGRSVVVSVIEALQVMVCSGGSAVRPTSQVCHGPESAPRAGYPTSRFETRVRRLSRLLRPSNFPLSPALADFPRAAFRLGLGTVVRYGPPAHHPVAIFLRTGNGIRPLHHRIAAASHGCAGVH